MPAIRVRALSKRYALYRRPWDKLAEMFHLGGPPEQAELWALDGVSFDVERGETVGLIGQNGSGKSTLLQILAGILRQTRGDCFVQGKIAALLELGSGFNPEFTGRENVYMNGAILGLSTAEMARRFDAIARFAEIGAFVEQPVKTYSSGMFMRLAFAVAVHVDPDILLVDEALAVGDLVFQHRCMHHMNRLRDSGATILLVTHDLGAVTRFCDRALLLDRGRLLEDGKPDAVVQRYRALVFERERTYAAAEAEAESAAPPASGTAAGAPIPAARGIPNVDHRFGSGEATLLGVEFLDGGLRPTALALAGEPVTVRVSAEFYADVEQPIVGYTLRDRLGVEISACNTSHAERPLPPVRRGQIVTCDFAMRMPPLAPGSYSNSPAVARGNLLRHDMCDWIDNALVFTLRSDSLVYGLLQLDVAVRSYIETP
jgi:ABC-type polysaccharide/polyol phosphate transport system ATPase subunit